MTIELNKKAKSAIAVFAIIAFVYAFCFIIIPFPKNAASWISFVFTLISVIAGLGIFTYAFKNGDSLVSKIYGFPIFRIGYLYIAAQFIVGVLICLVAAFVAVPYWVALVLSIILLGLASIGVIATDNTRDIIEEIEEETERVTKATKIFNLDIQAIVDLCTEESVKKELVKLAEAIKYSDPVSSEATEDAENTLFEEISILRELIEVNDTEKSLTQITKVTNLLNERNRICKAFKK